MKYLVTTLIITLLLACGNHTKYKLIENDNLHVIDLNNATHLNNLNLSKLFKNVTPIILETTEESLIGHISKVLVTPNHIIILDNIISNSIFVFDKNGYFLHKLGHLGTGPGEYASISDFCFDMLNTVYVMDFQSQKINQYELNTGAFIKSIKLSRERGMSWFIDITDNGLYSNFGFFNNEKKGGILNQRNEKTGEIIDSWFNVDKYSFNIDFISNNNKSPFLCNNGKSFKFKTFFMDSIMVFEDNRIMPFLTFTSEYQLESKDLKGIDFNGEDYFTKLSMKNKIYDMFTYIEHKDLIIMQFFLGIDARTIIYNQKEKKATSINFFIDDIIYKQKESRFSFPNFLTFDEKGTYAWLNYDNINELKGDLEKGYLSSKFESNGIKSLNEESNPILLYYEFKN